MDINGWNDLNMDWNNPDPRSYTYLYALWSAINERCNAFQPYQNISTPVSAPKQGDTCNFDYMRKIINQIRYFYSDMPVAKILGRQPYIYVHNDLSGYYKDFTLRNTFIFR